MECINRFDDNPFASEEKRRCQLPDASVSDVQAIANKSNDEDAGDVKNVLVGEVNVVTAGTSIVKFGIHNGVTPGGNFDSLSSSTDSCEKNLNIT
jgi:hypothetical protein